MKHIFIINPTAGKKDSTEKVVKEIKGVLNEDEYIIYKTKAPLDATEYVKKMCEEIKEDVCFYACGGDGTLNEVANGAALCPNAYVTSYPIGSGNDFLKYFGDPKNFLDLKSLINGKRIAADILKFGDKYILNICNMGFDADVCIRMEKYKKLPLMSGKGAYNLGVLVTFLKKMNNKFKITIDDDEVIFDDYSMLCTVSNGICYGGGYYCAPKALIDDGLIDVCIVKKISKFSMIKMIKKYKVGKHLEDPKFKDIIIYRTCKRVRIESEKPVNYSRDGEVGSSLNIYIELIPKGINFVIPNKD